MALCMIVFCLDSAAQYLCKGIEGWFAHAKGSAELFCLVLRVCLSESPSTYFSQNP